MEIRDKNIIVTGGANGIGKTLVENLVIENAHVIVIDKDLNALTILNKKYPEISCFECDVTDYTNVETTIEAIYDKFQKIDALVNNAGILYSEPIISFSTNGIKKHDITMWNKVLSIDLCSVFFITVTVVEKMMLKRTKGLIVNISSICAAGNAGQSAYSAAKAGVNALTKTWSKELSLMGIRVAGIAPGYFDIDSTHAAMSESGLKELKKEIPLRRLGKIDEVIDAILFVIRNDYFNGKILEIDGGLVI